MKIILVRHGKHESNEHNGNLLTEGRGQAKLLALKLKGVKIDRFYCSDLRRAKETADILEKELKIPARITSALREWDSKIVKQDKEAWKKEHRDNFNMLMKFLDKLLLKKKEKKNILIVAHGQLNKLVISILMGIDSTKTVSFMQDNTCINILAWNEQYQNWRLLLLNDTSHLNKNLDKLATIYRQGHIL